MAYQLSKLTVYNTAPGIDNSNSASVECHSGYERITDPSECTKALIEANNSGITITKFKNSCQSPTSEKIRISVYIYIYIYITEDSGLGH